MVHDRLLRPEEPTGLCCVPVAVRMFGPPRAISEVDQRFNGKPYAGSEYRMSRAVVVGVAHSHLADGPIRAFERVLLQEDVDDLIPVGAVLRTKTHSYLLALPETSATSLTVFDWRFT